MKFTTSLHRLQSHSHQRGGRGHRAAAGQVSTVKRERVRILVSCKCFRQYHTWLACKLTLACACACASSLHAASCVSIHAASAVCSHLPSQSQKLLAPRSWARSYAAAAAGRLGGRRGRGAGGVADGEGVAEGGAGSCRGGGGVGTAGENAVLAQRRAEKRYLPADRSAESARVLSKVGR
jgi:hypothetical protein